MSWAQADLSCYVRLLRFIDINSRLTYKGSLKLFKNFPYCATWMKGFKAFRQYLPLKTSQFGINTFNFCESNTGCLWCFFVYAGKTSEIESTPSLPDITKITASVTKLLELPVNRWHTMWLDNYYNNPQLAIKRKVQYSTDCVGTLRWNRKSVTKEVQEKKLRKGKIIPRHSGPISVLKWCDKKSHHILNLSSR
jgi:hypothetical protein